MARMARAVMPGVPHYVTQRGNRLQDVFFSEEDYAYYRDLLAESAKAAGTAVWAYCLLPNKVHLILVPDNPDGLRAAVADAHRRYTRHINQRQGWRGHLWQERFHSFPMDDKFLLPCARYVEMAPVRTGLVRKRRDWKWSSAKAHLKGRDDGLVTTGPLLKKVKSWKSLLKKDLDPETLELLRLHGRTGRPLGPPAFLDRLEGELDRVLRPRRPGRPRKNPA